MGIQLKGDAEIRIVDGEGDTWTIQATDEPVSSTMMLNEYEAGAFHVAGVDGTLSWQAPREAASGWVEENISDAPRILAHGVRQGCTIVWFAKSSSGEVSARIDAVTPSDGVEIRLKNGCIWMMQLVGTDLVIYRKFGWDTLDISVVVVKL